MGPQIVERMDRSETQSENFNDQKCKANPLADLAGSVGLLSFKANDSTRWRFQLQYLQYVLTWYLAARLPVYCSYLLTNDGDAQVMG